MTEQRIVNPESVTVRLDGLVDKIAAQVNCKLTWRHLLGDKWTDDQFAESLVALLQSLAVQ